MQCPDGEIDLIYQAWKELRNRVPKTIREDFCGTCAVGREWVKKNENNVAFGVDKDQDVLAWARVKCEKSLLYTQKNRITLVEGSVENSGISGVDCVLAMNFSYYSFKQRSQLLGYFSSVRKSLLDDGLFLLDAYGGSDSFLEMSEERDLDGFTYVWDQSFVNPISGDVINYIHFEFPNGSKIERAFTYDWRLWTLPEIKDVLIDAGFSRVDFYWEGTCENGGGNGLWKIDSRGEACAGWIAYIAASC